MDELAYSFSLTTFSPTGHLRQITHALAAVNNGRLSIGIKCRNGVVLLSHKIIENPLIDRKTVKLVTLLSSDLGITYSGLSADFRNLLSFARKDVEEYRCEFDENAPVSIVAKDVASIMQEYTQRGGVRPFGCSVLVAGKNADKSFVLYQCDPSGAYYSWKATANGASAESARSFLEKRYNDNIDVEDAIILGLTCLMEVSDGDVTGETVEVGVIGGAYSEDKFSILGEADVQTYVDQIE